MRKVVHIVNGDFYGGAEKVQELLSLELTNYDYLLKFITLKNGHFMKNFKGDKDNIVPFGLKGLFDFKNLIKIRKYVRLSNTQIIHCHTPRSLLVGVLCTAFSDKNLFITCIARPFDAAILA
ncbi:hypothetical protein [Thalassotalea sp. PS06]|uniref:hypothetical protein n=1 Tax=Thalassotalea sp. PS06 TaxID=2594005 RepID=UPI0011627380|nr:hypothetical protein [Thalassotalea sp. PS06]QDP01983.1 hypothetical protein FNC98_11905 [Thalassotalea sp. PS06]